VNPWVPGTLECPGTLGAGELFWAQEHLGVWGLLGPVETWGLGILDEPRNAWGPGNPWKPENDWGPEDPWGPGDTLWLRNAWEPWNLWGAWNL
jgi:hypothetical protein